MPGTEPLRLIVNADDFGASRAINDAIATEIESGRVTSATIMANAPEVCDALDLARSLRSASYGIHLVATEHEPLSNLPGLRPLLAADGRFFRWPGSALNDPTVLVALFHEFSAQVERLQQAGVTLTHIDSHHHIHCDPRLMPVIVLLGRKYGIRSVRNAQNLFRPDHRPRISRQAAKRLWAGLIATVGSFRLTSYFAELRDIRAQGPRFGANRSAELMLHPGHAGFANENAEASGDWRQNLPFPTRLINYRQL